METTLPAAPAAPPAAALNKSIDALNADSSASALALMGGKIQLYLQLLINQRDFGDLVPVTEQDGHFWLPVGILRRTGLSLPQAGDGPIDVNRLAGVKVDYDAGGQRLLLTVPSAWLPRQSIGSDQLQNRYRARSSFGLLANYDLYAAQTQGGQGYASLWNEWRIFGKLGALSNTGTYQHNFAAMSGTARNRYRRYDSSWRYSDEDRMLTYETGDFVTHALPWSSTVRLGGVQLSRDFSVRPDVVTYPLPQFAGQAAVPSAVDLFLNGYKTSNNQVEPGPFTLTDIPYINGAGEATLVTTDALGRRVQTLVPFYVANTLLKPGLADYTVALGAIRKNYGSRNFDYGKAALSSSYRYGVNRYVTLESHAEAAPSFALGGVGGLLRVGRLGVFNLAASESYRGCNGYRDFYQDEDWQLAREDPVDYSLSLLDGRHGHLGGWQALTAVGQQYAIGYQYTRRRFNLNVQRIQRSRGFADLSTYGNATYRLSRRSTQVTASFSLDRYGTLGGGYFNVKSADGLQTRLLNLSYNISVWKNNSLYMMASRQLSANEKSVNSGSNGWSTALELIVPLGDMGTFNVSFDHEPRQGNYEQASYSRSVPTAGGFGLDLARTRYDQPGQANQNRADLAWRNPYLQLQGGIYGSTARYTRWGEASGSLVWMDEDVFVANKIADAFVVVSTDGVAKVPVRYENQLMGKTNRQGHMLMPWATSYYAGKYAIDTIDLPADMQAAMVEQQVAVKAGSGYLLEFPMKKVVAANIKLVDAAGKPLPIGSTVTANGLLRAYVGWDGMVYFEGLQAQNRLQAQWPNGRTCKTDFALDVHEQQIAQLGPLLCR